MSTLRSVHRHLILALFLLLSAAQVQAATPTPVPSLSVQFTTDRGCLETGQSPSYAVGEIVRFLLRAHSPSSSQASATLYDIPAGGEQIIVIGLGTIFTNATYTFAARIAPPTGIEQVIFKAQTGSLSRQRSCSFIVTGAATRTPTGSPPPTHTPTLTRTPKPTATATPTGGFPFQASIRTNRGCLEDGDDPVFHVGESVLIAFRVNGPSARLVYGAIADHLANGDVFTFGLGFFPTNWDFAFRALVAPPLGVERVELRARVGSKTATASCSFTVEGPAPTRTRTGTRTRTPIRTPHVSHTPTGTPTGTPTP